MDLRSVTRPEQRDRAKRLAFKGLLNYQPYFFADDFAVGSGLSVLGGFRQPRPPSIYCEDASRWGHPAYIEEAVVQPNDREAFFNANQRMETFYDRLIDMIDTAVGGLSGWSVLDVGGNAGYFALRCAQRDATRVLTVDREPYGETIALLNDICGTHVQFQQCAYSGELKAPHMADLVLSVAVLTHLSEPLRHLTYLASATTRALAVFTNTHPGDDLTVKFHGMNRYYKDGRFPHCFDIVSISQPLLRASFTALGFDRTIEITAACEGMGPNWPRFHLGLVGLRD